MTSIFSRQALRSQSRILGRNLKARNKSFNSNEWLKRREADRYVELSRRENYRCRSAFKLLEIDKKCRIIKPGLKVLDLGAAPGSWSEILAERTNSNGKDQNSPVGSVIAVDLCSMQSIPGVTILPMTDFTQASSQTKILETLGAGESFDFIFSDMAPAATGVKPLDQDQIINLVYCVFVFALKNLKVGGGCLTKVLEGGETKILRNEVRKFFNSLINIKPSASYSNSSEYYILAREFKGLKKSV